ncbi:MAG: tRNA lysidine(34) synthetase TilS [Pseudomonadota bacterium]|nr:tRNA lysidine(34) synthetase TilS [Pseudomonadota bacterium]
MLSSELNTLINTLDQHLNPNQSINIGLSGGMDSVCLLHLCTVYRRKHTRVKLAATHVNHGLSHKASQWADHCANLCDQWSIEYRESEYQLNTTRNIEQVARHARWQAFSQHTKPGEVLLLGHHQHDQVETLLLRLLRGSGLKGMLGIPLCRQHRHFKVLRPLLEISKSTLLRYAKHHKLSWIEDESNQNQQFDRNFIRLDILPRLKKRWPQIEQKLTTSHHALKGDYLFCQSLMSQCHHDILIQHYHGMPYLSWQMIKQYPQHHQIAILRYWIGQQQFYTPSQAQLTEFIRQTISGNQGTRPKISTDQYEIIVDRHRIFIVTHDWLEQLAKTKIKTCRLEFKTRMTLPCWQLDFRNIDTLEIESVKLAFWHQLPSINLQQSSSRIKKIGHQSHVPLWLKPFVPCLLVKNSLTDHDNYSLISIGPFIQCQQNHLRLGTSNKYQITFKLTPDYTSTY